MTSFWLLSPMSVVHMKDSLRGFFVLPVGVVNIECLTVLAKLFFYLATGISFSLLCNNTDKQQARSNSDNHESFVFFETSLCRRCWRCQYWAYNCTYPFFIHLAIGKSFSLPCATMLSSNRHAQSPIKLRPSPAPVCILHPLKTSLWKKENTTLQINKMSRKCY